MTDSDSTETIQPAPPDRKRSRAGCFALVAFVAVIAVLAFIDLWPWLTVSRSFTVVQSMVKPGDAWTDARTRLERAHFSFDEMPARGPGDIHDNPEIAVYSRISYIINSYARVLDFYKIDKLPQPPNPTCGVGMVDINSSSTVVGVKKGIVYYL